MEAHLSALQPIGGSVHDRLRAAILSADLPSSAVTLRVKPAREFQANGAAVHARTVLRSVFESEPCEDEL